MLKYAQMLFLPKSSNHEKKHFTYFHCRDSQHADNNAGIRAKRVTTDIADDAALTVYPNSTDDLLFVELRGAEIACVALYDLQGRMVTAADGKEYHQKVVKR